MHVCLHKCVVHRFDNTVNAAIVMHVCNNTTQVHKTQDSTLPHFHNPEKLQVPRIFA